MSLDTQLGQLLVEAASARDPGGKYAKVYAITSPDPSLPVPTPLADTNRTTAGAQITGTLAHLTGKLVYVQGFRITAQPIAASVGGQVTLSGLAQGKTFSYEFAALVGAIAQVWETFEGAGLAANDGSTDIVLTVPALALATVSLNIWGYRI